MLIYKNIAKLPINKLQFGKKISKIKSRIESFFKKHF